jgi:hypothetical protein
MLVLLYNINIILATNFNILDTLCSPSTPFFTAFRAPRSALPCFPIYFLFRRFFTSAALSYQRPLGRFRTDPFQHTLRPVTDRARIIHAGGKRPGSVKILACSEQNAVMEISARTCASFHCASDVEDIKTAAQLLPARFFASFKDIAKPLIYLNVGFPILSAHWGTHAPEPA